VEKRHLPRLPPEHYRGRAFVHWTLTIEDRQSGWLTPTLHQSWRLILLHTCARYSLLTPAYTQMPDHGHLLWLGRDDRGSDQRVAIEFLRRHTSPLLAPTRWQRQPYDNVLGSHDRERGSFQKTAEYILQNPVRAGLTATWQHYPHNGCCVPGYPNLDLRQPEYWEIFWRIYNGTPNDRRPLAHARSYH
jgi:putative transposase